MKHIILNLQILVFMSVLIFAKLTFADVTVSATVDRNEMEPGDVLTLTVNVVANDAENIEKPVLSKVTGLDTVKTWLSDTSARSVFIATPQGQKFQTVREQNFNYMLQAKQEGKFTIGAIEVAVDGKTYRTKPISIQVAKGLAPKEESFNAGRGRGKTPQARPRSGRGGLQLPPGFTLPPGFFDEEDEDLFGQLLQRSGPGFAEKVDPKDAFFVSVDADKSDIYINEQLTVTWHLYVRASANLRDLDTLKYPNLHGFWKEDIEIASHLNFTNEVVNGVPYRRALLASYALFPIKEGALEIDAYKAKCTVITDPFGGFGFGGGSAVPMTKESRILKVNVKPLPLEGRTASFTGGVGEFQTTARVEDQANIFTGQPFSLKYRIEGRGNAKPIDLPPLDLPEGLEFYDSQKEAKFFRTGTSYKDFTVLLVPRKVGELVIPPIVLTVFDPVQKKYVSKTTEPIRLTVQKGSDEKAVPPLASSSLQGGAADVDQGPKPPELLLKYENVAGASNFVTGLASGFFFLLAVFALVWKARVELGWGQRKQDLRKKIRARLKRVNERLQKEDWRGVGIEMTNAVYFILGEISGQGGANLELEKLLRLAPPSVRRELEVPMAKLLEVFQTLSFAPETVVGQLKSKESLEKYVKEAEVLMERAASLALSDEPADASSGDRVTS